MAPAAESELLVLQIAKLHDVEVTCVDKVEKLDMLKSLGADHVIDYNKTNYTTSDDNYDLIMDIVTNQSLKNYIQVLRPNGQYIVVGGKTSTIIKIVIFGKLYSKIYGKHLRLLIHKPNRDDLEYLSELYLEGKLKVVIGKLYKLAETPEAIKQLSMGNILGKAVISIT